jgi:hypothetical protein
MNLIGEHFAWVLTSGSIGEIEEGSATPMHEGILGKSLRDWAIIFDNNYSKK